MNARILIAGIGNVFQGDDAFGVEVAQRLSALKLPEGVEVKDFGIRGFDLAYALMEPWDLAILVDATQRGGAPGTLYVVEPHEISASELAGIETHGMTPLRAIEMVKALGGEPPRMLVVGCEPGELGGDDGVMGFSSAVEHATVEAINLVQEKVTEFLAVPVGEALSEGART
jgi:hydrogenase maturation protease